MTQECQRLWPDADVLGVPVCRVSVREFIDRVSSVRGVPGVSGNPLFITYLNAACSNTAADDTDYQQILREADCVYADGQAIVWASRFLGQELRERVNAGDFIVEFCRAAAGRGVSIGLLGGRPEVAWRAAEAWRGEVPSLRVSGTWDGFFTDGGARVAGEIAKSGTNILLVGMGVPLQEKWAWKHRRELGVDVIWCVGALFEYYGEGRARAPVWVRKGGLEWLFRLVLEPRRLWRRYVIGNVRFVWRCIAARRIAGKRELRV